jgi:hypothetical protein
MIVFKMQISSMKRGSFSHRGLVVASRIVMVLAADLSAVVVAIRVKALHTHQRQRTRDLSFILFVGDSRRNGTRRITRQA